MGDVYLVAEGGAQHCACVETGLKEKFLYLLLRFTVTLKPL